MDLRTKWANTVTSGDGSVPWEVESEGGSEVECVCVGGREVWNGNAKWALIGTQGSSPRLGFLFSIS